MQYRLKQYNVHHFNILKCILKKKNNIERKMLIDFIQINIVSDNCYGEFLGIVPQVTTLDLSYSGLDCTFSFLMQTANLYITIGKFSNFNLIFHNFHIF